MIELLLICALGNKPTAPCPPPPPPPVEKPVGLPAKNVELTDDTAEQEGDAPYVAGNSFQKPAQKVPKAKARSSKYNRRGNRNH